MISLFAVESIPSAMITFVALLMFVQLGVGWSEATLLCGLLTLPWMLQSFFHERVQRWGHYVSVLKVLELAVFITLVVLAFGFQAYQHDVGQIFVCMVVLSVLCAWHGLVARLYYERKLSLRYQRIYAAYKLFFSQCAVILTYGVMIMTVGALEVFYHNQRNAVALSWSMAIYLMAGCYLLLFIANLFLGRSPRPLAYHHKDSTDLCGGRCIPSGRHRWLWIVVLFLLLLPQSLMFHTRVLFLLASQSDGGLGVSLQWVGLSQGTVGVMAYSVGLGIGFMQMQRYGHARVFWPMCIALGLSPLCYWLMTQYPPTDLLTLCLFTGGAQLCFGYGLNVCMVFVRLLVGDHYRYTINFLYIPLVAVVMLLPVAASGWLVQLMGFNAFFEMDALLAIPAYFAAFAGWSSPIIKSNR